MDKTLEKYVSILGLADDVLMFCLSAAFDSYSKHNIVEKSFQVSPHESENSTTGILIVVTGLESFVKRLEYIVKSTTDYAKYIPIFNYTVCSKCKLTNFLPLYEKASQIIGQELNLKFEGITLNRKMVNNMLQELSKVRNNITHNYLYEFTVQYDEEYNLKDWNYTDIPKNKAGIKNDKTKYIGFNKIPNQISFMDILKAMLVFDTVIRLMELAIKGINYRFGGYHKLNGSYVQSFYQVFNYYLLEMIKLGKKEDAQEINDLIVRISTILQVESIDTESLESGLLKHLNRSNLLRETIINHVSLCSKCNTESLMINSYGTTNCLNCTIAA